MAEDRASAGASGAEEAPDVVPTPDSTIKVLVIGVGNPLREDDGVGPVLLERIEERFGPSIKAITLFAPDLTLSEDLSRVASLIVIDAYHDPIETPFIEITLKPSGRLVPEVGCVSHIFDWGTILSVAGELFGGAPEAVLVGVRARNTGIRESMSEECKRDAEEAYKHIVKLIEERLK